MEKKTIKWHPATESPGKKRFVGAFIKKGCKADYGRTYQYYVAYTGQRLTRRLTPYVDGSRTAIYDDGTREVKLVRAGKEG